MTVGICLEYGHDPGDWCDASPHAVKVCSQVVEIDFGPGRTPGGNFCLVLSSRHGLVYCKKNHCLNCLAHINSASLNAQLSSLRKEGNKMKRMVVALLIVCLLSVNGFAYGPRGHQLVGAIADRRLAHNPTVAKKVRKLLDGMTLQRASTLPDEIKSWECGKQPSGPNRINRELQAFVNANCSNSPKHAEFHYTDVPVAGNEKYAPGTVGRTDFDVVK